MENKPDIFEPNAEGLFEGEPIKIRGREIIIPALSFGQIESLSKPLNNIFNMKQGKALSPQEMQDMQKVIHAAISRNYPKATITQVSEIIDLRNFQAIIRAILGQSGFEEQNQGASAGETAPVA